MPTSSDVFILSVARAATPGQALQQALKESGVNPARVQDLLFGTDGPVSVDAQGLARAVRLTCPALTLPSSLRALFFAAQAILCEEADLVLVGGTEADEAAALLLGSPAVVGIYNLPPLARLDARSLSGADTALAKAGLTPQQVDIRLEGTCGALLAARLLADLRERQAQWGMLSVGAMTLLLERL